MAAAVLVLLVVRLVEQLQAQAATELRQALQAHQSPMVAVALVVDTEELFTGLLRLVLLALVVVVRVI